MKEGKEFDQKELHKEWKNLFKQTGDYYIYGAGNTAKKVLKIAVDIGISDKIKGFVVSDREGNPNTIEGLQVMGIRELEDNNAVVLVPHAGVFKRQIYSLLEELEFANIYSIHKLVGFTLRATPQKITDVYMGRAREREKEYTLAKSREEKEKDAELCELITQIRNDGQPDFGQGQFYQSFEKIGLTGTRPTLYRLEKYGIEEFLNKKQDVLDIGCNTGFLDMTVAPLVNTVTGIEYDRSLTDVANCVKKYIRADNCTFINRDFHDWHRGNNKTYAVIFSFAIHHWLNLKPEEYVKKIDGLLKEDGYLCFESHDLCGGDDEYEKCLNFWLSMGYKIKIKGNIMDDGITQRDYTILWKNVSGEFNDEK